MLQNSTGRARFLVDVEFYHHLARRLHQLSTAEEQTGAYVLIGLWRCDPNTPIGIPGEVEEQTIRDWLRALDANDVHVGLVLWEGRNVSHGKKCYQNSTAMQQLANQLEHVEVYREAYAGTGVGSSTHQKMFVFSDGETLEAVVGGFNLHPHYFFQPDHGPRGKNGEEAPPDSKNNLWHDTAVALRGPVARVVQDEWERRWQKQPGGGAAFLERIHEADPSTEVESPYEIRIATTNSEAGAAEQDIRAQLIAEIGAAQSSIYLENYALNDPAIVQALSDAMRANDALNVIVVVNHPQAKNIEGNQAWTYLMWYTFVELSLVDPTSITAAVPNPDVVVGSFGNVYDATIVKDLAAPAHTFQVQDALPKVLPLRHQASPEFLRLYYRYVEWDGPEKGGDYVHNLRNIVGPEVMYSPKRVGASARYWPYVHSKLALFDDKVAFVGSANWTYRSMEFDGELTAIIRDDDTVAAMRGKLFEHWSPGLTLANWKTRYGRDKVEAGASGSIWMDTLSFDDFIHPEDVGWTDVVLVAAWYQPQAF